MREVVATQAQLTPHHDRSTPHAKMHGTARAAASSSSSHRCRQQLTSRGYKRRPLHLVLVYLHCTSEVVTLTRSKCRELYLPGCCKIKLSNGEEVVEQTELQAAVHVRAVGRGQPARRGRNAVVVVVVRQGVRVQLQLQQQTIRAAADLPALRPGQRRQDLRRRAARLLRVHGRRHAGVVRRRRRLHARLRRVRGADGEGGRA